MRRKTKQLLLRLIPIIVIFIAIVSGFVINYFMRIPSEWNTGTPLGEYETSTVGFDVNTQNNLVYISSGNSCLIIDADDPTNPSLLAEYDKESPAKAIDYQDELLAISGIRDVNFVDVSDPSSPTNLSVVEVHINYTVADVVLKGDFALVAVHPNPYAEPDLNYRVLYAFNITDPENPIEVDVKRRYGFQSYSMNVHQDIAYIINPTSGIVLYNVTDPTNIIQLGFLNGFGLVPTLPYAVNAMESGISQTSTATYIIIADYDNGYIVADVSNPTNPLPGSGIIMGNCISIDVTYDYAYILQRNGTVSVFSMEDPSLLKIAGRFDAYDEEHNARDIHVHQATNKMYVLHNHGLSILQLSEGEINEYYRQEAKSRTLTIAIIVSFVITAPLAAVVIMRHRDPNAYTSRIGR